MPEGRLEETQVEFLTPEEQRIVDDLQSELDEGEEVHARIDHVNGALKSTLASNLHGRMQRLLEIFGDAPANEVPH